MVFIIFPYSCSVQNILALSGGCDKAARHGEDSLQILEKKIDIFEKCEIEPLGNRSAYTVYVGFFVYNSEVKARDNREISNLNKDTFRKLPASPATFPAGRHQ